MHPDAVVRRRALSPKELAAAFAGAQEISGVARRWKDRAHHPVALAIYAAQKAGWQFVNAVTLRDASGQERSLVHGSPAALRQLLLQDLRSSNASRDACAAAQRLEAPSGIVEDLLQRGVWRAEAHTIARQRGAHEERGCEVGAGRYWAALDWSCPSQAGHSCLTRLPALRRRGHCFP